MFQNLFCSTFSKKTCFTFCCKLILWWWFFFNENKLIGAFSVQADKIIAVKYWVTVLRKTGRFLETPRLKLLNSVTSNVFYMTFFIILCHQCVKGMLCHTHTLVVLSPYRDRAVYYCKSRLFGSILHVPNVRGKDGASLHTEQCEHTSVCQCDLVTS